MSWQRVPETFWMDDGNPEGVWIAQRNGVIVNPP